MADEKVVQISRQFHQADLALTNLTIRQHSPIRRYSLSLTKFRQICHFRYGVHFWTNVPYCSEVKTTQQYYE